MSSGEGAEVIDISKYFRTQVSSASHAEVDHDLHRDQSGEMRADNAMNQNRIERRPISELYPGLEKASLLQSVLTLTSEGLAICQRALELLEEEQYIDADLETMRIMSVATELFCCRAIGDGLANVADMLMTSLRLLAGSPMDRDQIIAIRSCFERLYDCPAIGFEDSLDLAQLLDDSGLRTEPDLGGIAEDEQSLR